MSSESGIRESVSAAEDDGMSSESGIREGGVGVEGGSATPQHHASSLYSHVYAFVADQYGSEPVPRGIVKTFADPEWRKALLSEFDSLVTNKVFVIEDPPKQYAKVMYYCSFLTKQKSLHINS